MPGGRPKRKYKPCSNTEISPKLGKSDRRDDQGPTNRAMVKIVSWRHHTCSSHRF